MLRAGIRQGITNVEGEKRRKGVIEMAEEMIGMVEDFFAHPVVAGIELTGTKDTSNNSFWQTSESF